MMTVYYPTFPSAAVVLALQERVGSAARIVTEGEPPVETEMLIEGRPSRELLDKLPSLRWVVIPFAGVPEATLAVLRQSEISLHNLHHNAPETAELAMALLLAAAKQTVPMDIRMRSHDWTPRYELSKTMRLEGKTALVLGYGEIGQRVARACEGLGMKVIAVRRTPHPPAPSPRHSSGRGGEPDARSISELPSLLPIADVLMLCLPQTAETIGLIGAKELSLLKKGAILVNIARAVIVDEEALYNALSTGHLHSAGLDVWYRYPQDRKGHGGETVPNYYSKEETASNTPPSSFPFHELENLVMSPHRGGLSTENEKARTEHLARIILAASHGEDVPNRVDLEQGY
ncbi:MAG: NAD(P)-dependent oxidoreductase [Fimbriimonadaceae bacterium]